MKANTIKCNLGKDGFAVNSIHKKCDAVEMNEIIKEYRNYLDNATPIHIDGKCYRVFRIDCRTVEPFGLHERYEIDIKLEEIKEVVKMEKKNELEEFKEFCDSRFCDSCKYEDCEKYEEEVDCFYEWLKDNNKLISSYQNKVQRTRSFSDTELANYTLGLVCEAGEVGDIIKKHVYHDHELDKDKVIDELGDVMWYLNNICNVLDIKIEDVANRNIEKLLKRYPSGFSSEHSINREV